MLRARNLITAVIAALITPLLLASPVASASPRPVLPGSETVLTLKIGRCEGCVVTATSNDGILTPFESMPATVYEGSATVTVPSERTFGLSIQVRAPWEDHTARVTNVVFRYGGQDIGDVVTFKQARAMRWASGCWAGTVNTAVTLKIKVRKVRVGSPAGRVYGSLAWAPVTESFVKPVVRARRGVLSRQDLLTCQATN